MTVACAFQGVEEMVTVLDSAVQKPRVPELAEELKGGLSRLIRQGSIRLPDEVCKPCNGHYARRLLYRSEEHGYVVIAMIWGPGQGTLLHDHAGTWCVEGVLEGRIEVTQYDLRERREDGWRFHRMDTMLTGVGTAGSLIPPFEYHTIKNASSEARSITLHVYGEEMNHCTVFEPRAEGWYRKRTRQLGYDS